MATLYIDTHIFIDVIKDRKNIFGKDISTPAGSMFFRSISCEFNLAISTWTLKELYKQINPDDLKMIFALLKKKIIVVKYSDEDIETAKEKSAENFDDALHIVLAEKQKVDIIITRNTDHFVQIGTNIPLKKPENI